MFVTFNDGHYIRKSTFSTALALQIMLSKIYKFEFKINCKYYIHFVSFSTKYKSLSLMFRKENKLVFTITVCLQRLRNILL